MTQLTPRKLTLGRLARDVGLARASVLNYERIGLLQPAGRSPAGYRWYGEDEVERLRSIRRFREAGLSLAMIRELLKPCAAARPAPAALLEARLLELCQEVERLRTQQQLLARLLATPVFRKEHRCNDKAAWVAMLRRAGLNEVQMHAWHVSFEADSPKQHAAFLRSLGLGARAIEKIRRWSRAPSSARAQVDAAPRR
jgi:DNA-binding transcriptional MerR regulator